MTRIVTSASSRVLLPMLLLACVGCGYSAQNLSLDQPGAKAALTEFLDAWKAGKKVEELKESKKISGRDEDWAVGKKLVAYEILPGETSDGTNLHVPVKLKLESNGQSSEVELAYVIGTSPQITIFRDQ